MFRRHPCDYLVATHRVPPVSRNQHHLSPRPKNFFYSSVGMLFESHVISAMVLGISKTLRRVVNLTKLFESKLDSDRHPSTCASTVPANLAVSR